MSGANEFWIEEEEMEDIHKGYLMTLETSLDAIVSVDNKGIIRVWSRAAERTFGYSKEEALGKPVEMIIPEEYMERHREGFKRFASTGKGGFIGNVMEVEGLRRDGSLIPLELSLSALKINGWWATAVLRDISERKKLEDELSRRLEETERINKVMVGREIKMGEMKREIKRLKAIIEAGEAGEAGQKD